MRYSKASKSFDISEGEEWKTIWRNGITLVPLDRFNAEFTSNTKKLSYFKYLMGFAKRQP